MSKGILYVMTIAVPGLIKIGKTGTDNFEQRMYQLERNGYSNVTALKRRFAIEVEDYDDKEKLLDDIFNKSKVSNTELYALSVELVVQLLSSFEGTQIYPEEKTKEEVFDEATKEREITSEEGSIPNGEYYIRSRIQGFGEVKGTAIVDDGVFTVLKGAVCAPASKNFSHELRRTAPIVNNILMEDVICRSPSAAGWIILGRSNNGWIEWKDKYGRAIDVYRRKDRPSSEK